MILPSKHKNKQQQKNKKHYRNININKSRNRHRPNNRTYTQNPEYIKNRTPNNIPNSHIHLPPRMTLFLYFRPEIVA